MEFRKERKSFCSSELMPPRVVYFSSLLHRALAETVGHAMPLSLAFGFKCWKHRDLYAEQEIEYIWWQFSLDNSVICLHSTREKYANDDCLGQIHSVYLIWSIIFTLPSRADAHADYALRWNIGTFVRWTAKQFCRKFTSSKIMISFHQRGPP